MPLLKHTATPAQENVANALPIDAPVAAQAVAAEPVYKGRKATAELSKDDYWRRREDRDIETGIRIRRSGVYQAALQSVGLMQYCPTLDDYLKMLVRVADEGLKYVNDEAAK